MSYNWVVIFDFWRRHKPRFFFSWFFNVIQNKKIGNKQTPKRFCNLLFIQKKTSWSLRVSKPFEAEKVISPNSQEHLIRKPTALFTFMNLENTFSHWSAWNSVKFLLNVKSWDPGCSEVLKFLKAVVLRFWIMHSLTLFLCSMPMPYALLYMLYALCSMIYALCPFLYDICSMLYAGHIFNVWSLTNGGKALGIVWKFAHGRSLG